MGNSAEGMLVFGYDMGEGYEDKYKWLNPIRERISDMQDEEMDVDDFYADVMGFDEPRPAGSYKDNPEIARWYSRKKSVGDNCPFEVVHYGYYDNGCKILAARGAELGSGGWDIKVIDPESVFSKTEDYVVALDESIKLLGLEQPEDVKPQWFLTQNYG